MFNRELPFYWYSAVVGKPYSSQDAGQDDVDKGIIPAQPK